LKPSGQAGAFSWRSPTKAIQRLKMVAAENGGG